MRLCGCARCHTEICESLAAVCHGQRLQLLSPPQPASESGQLCTLRATCGCRWTSSGATKVMMKIPPSSRSSKGPVMASPELKACMCVLHEEEKMQMRAPTPQLHPAHRLLQACSTMCETACVNMTIWSVKQLTTGADIRCGPQLVRQRVDALMCNLAAAFLPAAVSCAGTGGRIVATAQRPGRQ